MKKSDLLKIANHLGDILLRSGYTRQESLDILEAIGDLIRGINNEHNNKKDS
jgi:hypothetical protein